MIGNFCDLLRRDFKEQREMLLQNLERGTPTRDADERLRGSIDGLRRAEKSLDDLEARARRAAANGDDML